MHDCDYYEHDTFAQDTDRYGLKPTDMHCKYVWVWNKKDANL